MLVLRPAVRGDVGSILALIRELAAYEREPAAAVATEEDLLRDGFGASPRPRNAGRPMTKMIRPTTIPMPARPKP